MELRKRQLYFLFGVVFFAIGFVCSSNAFQQISYIEKTLSASNVVLGEYSSEPNLHVIKLNSEKRKALNEYYSFYYFTKKSLTLYIVISALCFSLSFYMKLQYNKTFKNDR